MDAIRDGRPGNITSFNIGITDIKSNRIHDLGSRVKLFVKLTEFYQTNPIAERFVTTFYTSYLRSHVKGVAEKFAAAAKEYPHLKTWVIISTHFALAHSISAAKKILEEKFGIKIILCVVVTDDSPQRIWAVPNANLTFVASEFTKNKLTNFFPKDKAESVKIISFPIASRLSQSMTISQFKHVIDQLKPESTYATHIEIPVSGAAVHLNFFGKFINILCRENYLFTIIGQESILTKAFFKDIQKLPRVQLSIGVDPWQTVKFYESLFYQPNRPSIEITKPSEQAFKVLLNPRQRGGVILLLTNPIGRQEYDNLNFLIRNGFMANTEEQKMLFVEKDLQKWNEKAKNWRAIRLPDDPVAATDFIKRLKAAGIFYSMLSFVNKEEKMNLRTDGVDKIWEEIEKLL